MLILYNEILIKKMNNKTYFNNLKISFAKFKA